MIDACQSQKPPGPDASQRKLALSALLSTPAQGQVFLAGPSQAPVGYLALSFVISLARAAREARLDEIYIRERVRNRGLGSQILAALPAILSEGGITALRLELSDPAPDAERFFRRAGFVLCDGISVMRVGL